MASRITPEPHGGKIGGELKNQLNKSLSESLSLIVITKSPLLAKASPDRLYPVFLQHIPLAEELDLDPAFLSQSPGVLAKLVP